MLGNMGSSAARLGWATSYRSQLRGISSAGRKSAMPSAQRLDEPGILLLPEDLLNDIGSWLNDQELCNMERTNKEVHLIMSNPSRPGPGDRILDLGLPRFDGKHPPSQQASSWLQKRVRRYSHIVCVFRNPDDYPFPEKVGWGIPTCSIPPLLPALLAGCAPTTVLSLTVGIEGDKFLAMLSGGNAPSAIADPLSFKEQLKKHLTELTLVLYPYKAHSLGNVSMLTALQRLELPIHFTPGWYGPLMRDLEGQKIVLKLPHLVFLRLDFFRNGELVVICPKLAEARFRAMASMRIEVEEAALSCLSLAGCDRVKGLVESLKDKLQRLETLIFRHCGDVGVHLTNDICKMTCLQTLKYTGFLAACVSSSFLQSLHEMQGLHELNLCPNDWPLDLPEGLKGLHQLKMFRFDSNCVAWEIRRPLNELLPVDNLEELQLGCHTLDCTGGKAWRSKRLPRFVLKCAKRHSKHGCQHT